MRRKQTSIHFSRSALPHRYLRYISWISWNGHRPQPSTSWVFPHRAAAMRATFFRGGAYALRPQQLRSCYRHSEDRTTALRSFPKNNLLSFPHAPLACRFFCVALPASPARVACGPSAAGPSPAVHVAFCGLPINKKCGPAALRREPAHHKKRRLLAQENTRRHAWLTRSCFGRKNLFIDGPHSLLPFFLSPFLQGKEKRKQKQIQQVRIHRSDSLRSSSRCTRLARRASSAEIYVAIATRFVQDCVEDLDLLAASMERIPKCSWHIKDHCLGVIKASRTSLLLLRFSKFFPTKI